ncbi:phage tail tape measure protein [Microbacterium sp. 22296]|uniref:phage tail tape measure protein n=1 Tax=Microbacterium sp. 22296 TaxID=3453903 RepID=UPI003F84A307
MAAYRAGEVEVLLTVNDKDLARADKNVKATGEKIEKNSIKPQVETKQAIERMKDIETQAKKLVSERAVLKLDADISAAEKGVERTKNRLEDLRLRADAGFEVGADVARAERQLAKLEGNVQKLTAYRATVEVDADVSRAESAFVKAGDAADGAGEDAGSRFGGSVIAALATIPIAGAVAGIGYAAASALRESFENGLAIEARGDRLQALTGISEPTAARLGRAASEAYARGFGESIESNMDVTRLGLQFKIIDSDTTNRESQRVVEGLAGIADVLGEDVQPVARATAQLLRSGLAKNAQEAFDIIAAGQREGVNLSDDLLDTLSEYASTFEAMGLSGGDALGLINQGLEAGAPNTDFFADSLRELGIRIREGDDATAGFAERLGLVPAELQKAFIEGGPAARDALDLIFDRLRDTDPIDRNAIAVGLLGTQFEDLQLDLSKLDLSNAEASLNGVQGSAQRMFDTLADNDQARIQGAFRNIEVAAEGIQGALAAGLSEPLADVATFVSENRGPVLQFFLDMANGALDFGETMVEGAASGTEALGDLVGSLSEVVYGLSAIPAALGDQETSNALVDIANGMLDFSEKSDVAADTIRTNLNGAIDVARDKVNEFGEGAVAMGFLNDASLRLAESIGVVATNGEGAALSMEGLDLANRGASETGRVLEQQILNAAAALETELAAAQATGEGQSELTARYNTTRDALIAQIEQMGIGKEAAGALVDEILRTPESKSTAYSSNAPDQQSKVQSLATRIETLPDGSVVIRADTSPAQASIEAIQSYWNNRGITIPAYTIRQDNAAAARGEGKASGGAIHGPGGPREDMVPIMASNGEHMLTAEEVRRMGGHDAVYRLRRAVMNGSTPHLADGGPVRVPASSWETAPAAPVLRTGGYATPTPDGAQGAARTVIEVHQHGDNYSYDPTDIARAQREQLQRALDAHDI